MTLLCILAVCAASNVRADVPGCFDQEPSAQAIAELSAERQTTELRKLLTQRLEPAAAAVLTPGEFDKYQAWESRVLEKSAQGEHLSFAGAKSLVMQTAKLETTWLNALEKQYHASVEKHFKSPSAAKLRRDAWQRVLVAWTKSGGHFAEQPQLIEWLTTAIQRFESGELAKLPAMPQFAALSATPKAMPAVDKPRTRPSRPARGKFVQVNFEEYDGRVQGLNRSVATLVGKLAEERAWSISELCDVSAELTELGRVRRDLSLYWGIFSTEERDSLPPPVRLDQALTLLSGRVSAARKNLPFSDIESTADSETLELLSKQIADLKLRQSK
jgi:hypothetical protein